MADLIRSYPQHEQNDFPHGDDFKFTIRSAGGLKEIGIRLTYPGGGQAMDLLIEGKLNEDVCKGEVIESQAGLFSITIDLIDDLKPNGEEYTLSFSDMHSVFARVDFATADLICFTIEETFPPQGDVDVSLDTNLRIELSDIVSVYYIDVLLQHPTSTRQVVTNGIFQTGFKGPKSIIENHNDGSYSIIIDVEESLSPNAQYQIIVRCGGSYTQSESFSFTTTYEGNPNEEEGGNALRHTLHVFNTTDAEETRLDNINGFDFDNTFFMSTDMINNYIGLTSIWDPTTEGMNDAWFKSGIGYNKDLEPSKQAVSIKLGNFDRWSLDIFHGIYYISKYYDYLYSDNAARFLDFDTALSPWAHSVITLTESQTPKDGVPILVAYYYKVIGNYVPSVVEQKYQFSAKNSEQNTFCCKYCNNGSGCKYADIHSFDDRYTSAFMGKDYSDYYEPWSIDPAYQARCDNTSCPGHTLDNIEANIIWGNVSTEEDEFIYTRDTNKIICNNTLQGIEVEPKLYGYTNGATSQFIFTPHRNIDNVNVYIAGTPLVSGFEVDKQGGSITIRHEEILPTSLRSTYGEAVKIGYQHNYECVVEPSGTRDFYTPVDLNLNPLYSGITRGFVSLVNSVLVPDQITLETTKEDRGYNINDPVNGVTAPVHGPVYIGNDYAYLIATVKDTSGVYGISGVNVYFRVKEYGFSATPVSDTTFAAKTNAEGVAKEVYSSPSDSHDHLTYLKIWTPPYPIDVEFGTDTTFVQQDTLVLADSIPRRCLVNSDTDEFLATTYAVYKDDPSLGIENADLSEGEVEWETTGNYGSYKTNGRKEVLYRYDDVTDTFVTIDPARLGGNWALYDENGVLATEDDDLVKRIVYGDDSTGAVTASYLPHVTDSTNVGAYCISIPRFVVVTAEIDVGFGNDTYRKASNAIGLEVKLPEYMTGAFQISNLDTGFVKSFDGGSYLTIDPFAKFDLRADKLDPRLLGHTLQIMGYMMQNDPVSGDPLVDKNWLSMRHLIRIYGEVLKTLEDGVTPNPWANMRHLLHVRPANISAIRHILYAGGLTTALLRHQLQVVQNQTVGFDFTLDVVDPPSDGADIEFNHFPQKRGGALVEG